MFEKTPKYDALIRLYAQMASEGYDTRRGERVETAYSDQEAVRFRHELRALFLNHDVTSVLDYGGGGGDWREKVVREGGSLAGFVGISDYRIFEPAREIDQRDPADAVVCFDVLEHVFVGDVGFVLNDLFSQARKLVVINVAAYEANALLPTGENAHITIRSADWWKGAVDLVASAWPEVSVALYHSGAHAKAHKFPVFRYADINAADGFER
jgi:2-polyprenyl-3-methyl-5-hydroxy-6-metoxy-1,4-benzoquinol methylase